MASMGGPEPVQAALAELDAAREAVYYAAAADADSQAAYYQGIDGQASAEALFGALSALASRTHVKQPEYKPFLHLYPDVDLHPDGQLRSIYTGEAYDPVRLITEGAEIDQRRQEHLARRLVGPEALAEETLLALEAELDEALPFNCEHVVPQSWFGRREPMRGDLHHLFTCERECNDFRANHTFFDFPDFLETVRSGCGKREGNRFEPGQGKGEAARGMLYFLLRYPHRIDPTVAPLDAEHLGVLLEWHGAFAVSDYERRRNAVIHGKQGNRNPFVDHPDWAGPVAGLFDLGRPGM